MGLGVGCWFGFGSFGVLGWGGVGGLVVCVLNDDGFCVGVFFVCVWVGCLRFDWCCWLGWGFGFRCLFVGGLNSCWLCLLWMFGLCCCFCFVGLAWVALVIGGLVCCVYRLWLILSLSFLLFLLRGCWLFVWCGLGCFLCGVCLLFGWVGR